MASHMHSTRRRTAPKRRLSRPWKSMLSNPAVTPTQDMQPTPPALQSDFLQKQLQIALDQKRQEQVALTTDLTVSQESRITMGGFFHPKHLFSPEMGDIQKSTLILRDLRNKEAEIQAITNQLWLTQAEERVNHATAQLQSEATARHAAEEQAAFALAQAQKTAEQLRFAEERAYQAEQLNLTLKHTLNNAKVTHQENAVTLGTEITNLRQEIDLLSATQQMIEQECNESKQKLSQQLEQIDRLNQIVECERKLRKLFEAHAIHAA